MEPLFFLDAARVVDKSISKRTKAEERRKYLGGSQIGTECNRKAQYALADDTVREVEPRIQRIFDVGHTLEKYMAGLLKEAGFDIRTKKPNGKQYGFFLAGGKVRGHVDGVLQGFEGVIKKIIFPCLVEFKTAKSSTFTKFLRDGLMVSNMVYYSQIQFYQKNMELLNPAMFVMMNKDTQEMYYELVPHDPAHAKRLLNKAADIIDATDSGVMMDRAYSDKNNFNCKFCDHRDRCWDTETNIEKPASTPIWMA